MYIIAQCSVVMAPTVTCFIMRHLQDLCNNQPTENTAKNNQIIIID